MRTLKQLIQDWLNNHNEQHIARLNHFQKRADIMYQIAEYRLQRVYLIHDNMCLDDKDCINEFYENRIEQLNQEVYWLDLFGELKIKENERI